MILLLILRYTMIYKAIGVCFCNIFFCINEACLFILNIICSIVDVTIVSEMILLDFELVILFICVLVVVIVT